MASIHVQILEVFSFRGGIKKKSKSKSKSKIKIKKKNRGRESGGIDPAVFS